MDRNERARIVRAPLRADPPPVRRAARGPRWKSSALLRAEASRLKPLLQRGSGSARTMRAAPPGPLQRRWTADEKARRGAHTRCARSPSAQGCAVGEPRPAFTHPQGRMPGGRRCRGAFSFGSFSLGKQRKGTGPQGCGTNTQGCGSVIAKEGETAEQRKDMAKAPSPYPLQQAGEGNAKGCGTHLQGCE